MFQTCSRMTTRTQRRGKVVNLFKAEISKQLYGKYGFQDIVKKMKSSSAGNPSKIGEC